MTQSLNEIIISIFGKDVIASLPSLQEKNPYEKIEGKIKKFKLYDIDFIVKRNSDKTGWSVIEKTTGRFAGGGKTYKKAIEDTKNKIDLFGIDKCKKNIKTSIKAPNDNNNYIFRNKGFTEKSKTELKKELDRLNNILQNKGLPKCFKFDVRVNQSLLNETGSWNTKINISEIKKLFKTYNKTKK